MDLTEYRAGEIEQKRAEDLLAMAPECGGAALDVGARDGYFSRLLAERFEEVVALDLEELDIKHERITCIKGDVTALEFEDDAFDFVFCAEVLEHIPPECLATACSELSRVTTRYLLVGVPYKQEIRSGRTTCQACGEKNPPWGHVNSFDVPRLESLFGGMKVRKVSFVGNTNDATNALSVMLMDFAGNPYGSYDQDECCIFCDSPIIGPSERNVLQKVCTRASWLLTEAQRSLTSGHPVWVHMLLEKEAV